MTTVPSPCRVPISTHRCSDEGRSPGLNAMPYLVRSPAGESHVHRRCLRRWHQLLADFHLVAVFPLLLLFSHGYGRDLTPALRGRQAVGLRNLAADAG